MRLFRSKGTSRKNSTDSLNSNDSSQTEPRKLRKGSVPFPSKQPTARARPSLPTIPSQEATTRKKLTKRPTNDFPTVDISTAYERDKQTGEQKVDHTNLLHSLINDEDTVTTQQLSYLTLHQNEPALSGDAVKANLPDRIWQQIYDSLDLDDLVSLSFSCKAFYHALQQSRTILNQPENEAIRTRFFLRLDKSLPNHLLCFSCLKYHHRLAPGQEVLRPTNISNPVFDCPQVSNMDKRVSRVRITSGRTLPFTYTQLVHRYQKFSPLHGISPDTISRRYKDINTQHTGWSHQTRFIIVNGHLLMRVTSTVFATAGLPPAGLRNLLYNPAEEFHPYFSTCPHWRDGELMPLVKCALSHLPKPVEGGGISRVGKDLQQRFTYRSPIVTLCQDCRPMRRCPECPTEYLIEMKMTEDKKEIDPTKTFKQALSVTRWSDLGDGTTPENADWAACTGLSDDYDSLGMLGRRAIAGIFEGHLTAETIPGQRILNLNPNNEKKGEEGHKWY